MKKALGVLSTAAISGLVAAAAMSSTAFAATDAYLVKDNNTVYSYSVTALQASFLDSKMGKAAPLYEDFKTKLASNGFFAFHDSKNGFVDYKAIQDAFIANRVGFNVDAYTENATAKATVDNYKEASVANGSVVYTDKGTQLEPPVIVEIVKVDSVSSVTTTELTVTLSNKPEEELKIDELAVKVNGTDVKAEKLTKVDSDLTGKTYKLTIASLNNKEGKLTVNGTEKAFDFKAPEVTSIVPKGTRTLEVTFNEAIKSTTAITANFKVVKVSGDPLGLGTGTVALNADGTKATIALNNDLNIADHVLVLGNTAADNGTNRVKDVAGNSIYGGIELSFRPTAEQLAVKEAASITTAEYNNGTGEIAITFNKDVKAAKVDATKLTLGGVALTTGDVVAQNGDNAVKITLSADTKKAVNAVTGALNLVGAKDAWEDDTTLKTEGQSVAVTKVTPAVITSAAYNQETKVLTVNFDQPVKISTIANIKVNDANDSTNQATATGATNPDGTALATTAKVTWELKLAAAQSAELENAANDKAKLKVYMDAATVTSNSAVTNVGTTYLDGVAVAYTADTTKPYITGAEYDNRTKELKLTFSEALDGASLVNAKVASAVKIATSTGDAIGFDLSTEALAFGATNKVVTITVTPDNQTKLDNQYLTGKAIKAFFAKDVLVDANGLKNDATTFDTGIAVFYKDFIAPVATATAANQTYVKVDFTEVVDKATAETVANYAIKDLAGNTLAVTSAVLQADNKTVYLNTAKQEGGKPYSLVVSNVRDLQRNLVKETPSNFFGSTLTADGKLAVSTLTATAPVNAKNDTLTVSFDKAVNKVQAVNIANYAVLEAATNDDAGWAAAKAVSLVGAKAELNAAGNSVAMTLDNYNLQAGKFYKVAVANITDVYGNALDSTKTTAISVALDADNLTAPEIVEANTKEAAVKLVFDQELNATEAAKASNYKVGAAVPTKATYAFDATKNKATVILDLGTELAATADVLINKNVTNLAGEAINGAVYTQEMATLTKPATLVDKVAPTVDTVVAKAITGADDTIVVTFKDADILQASAELESNYVVKDGEGKVIPADTYVIAFADGGVGADKATITFKDTNSYNLQNGTNYTVTITGVLDTTGNALAETTKTVTWDAASDKTAPTVNAIAVTPGVAGTGKIEVTFDEDINATEATNKANYVVKTSADGAAWNTTLTPTIVTFEASTKKATIYFAEELKAAAAGNQYQVTVKNVKDLAGNVQVDGSSKIAQ